MSGKLPMSSRVERLKELILWIVASPLLLIAAGAHFVAWLRGSKEKSMPNELKKRLYTVDLIDDALRNSTITVEVGFRRRTNWVRYELGKRVIVWGCILMGIGAIRWPGEDNH